MTQTNATTTTPRSLSILFDSLGQQIQAQKEYDNRLSGSGGLFDTITGAGWSFRIGSVTVNDLQDVDVLVLTNRVTQGYSRQELSDIVDFVRGGKGVWCMSNHAAFHATNDRSQMNNHIRYESAVSTTFLTSYEAAAYQGVGDPPVPLTGANLTQHPIIRGASSWPVAQGQNTSEVRTVDTRSFCGVYQNHFTSTIAGLQGLDGVINYQDKGPVSEGVVWAVSLEGTDVTGSGRAVICADAGWLGNTHSNWPGPGQFQNGDNPQFALNNLAWLGQLD